MLPLIPVAPVKALCSERYEDWNQKFGRHGLKCMELTGDTDMDSYFDLQNVNIIFTTPVSSVNYCNYLHVSSAVG